MRRIQHPNGAASRTLRGSQQMSPTVKSPATPRRIGSRFVTMSAVLLLAACSGGDKIVGPDGSGGPPDTRLNAADSVYMAATLASASFDAINNLRRTPTTTLPAIFSNLPPCNPSVVTGGPDSNNNGIPDNRAAQYTTGGCTYVNNGVTTTVSGTARLEDVGGLIGYRATYTDFTVTATKGDSVIRTVISGTFEYRWASATSATYAENSTVSISAQAAGGGFTLSRSANLNGTFTPTSPSTIRTGFTFPSGTFTLNGTLSVSATATGNQVTPGVSPSQTLSLNVSTTTQLAVSSGCTSNAAYSSGALAATVSGSNQGALEVRFTACGSGPSTPTTAPPGKR